MFELTDEQKEAVELLNEYLNNDDTGKPFVLTGAAGCGKSTIITHFFSMNPKYKVQFLCYTGKGANVAMRMGMKSESIHHFMFTPVDLNSFKKRMTRITRARDVYNAVLTKNQDWNERDPWSEYLLSWFGDYDRMWYVIVNEDGDTEEVEVFSEADVPEDYELKTQHYENYSQSLYGRKEVLSRSWDIESETDLKDFLDFYNVIGFLDKRDESEGGNWLFQLRKERLYSIDILVIDECSMIPKSMMDMIIKSCNECGVKIILLGDYFQLPPVDKIDVPIRFKADINLTKVMRQAKDNPILKFATLIRMYGTDTAIKRMIKFQDEKFIIINNQDLTKKLLRQYKPLNRQVICGYNKTRIKLNKWIKGNSELEVGDKIIFTEINDWNYNIDENQYLTNGTQGIVTSLEFPDDYYYPEYRAVKMSGGEYDYVVPRYVEEPDQYDKSHDFRLSNYVCTVDFESMYGDHDIDNRKLVTLPIAICRSFDDDKYNDYRYLPKSVTFGYTSKGYPRKISNKDFKEYSVDHIVENFEGNDKKNNVYPKYLDNEIVQKYWKKAYKDFFECPDYRKPRGVQKLNNGEKKVVYNFDRTRPYKGWGHIAEHGYCVTCHKSQGSQWDDVMVIYEPVGNSQLEQDKWLYTAVTRAKDTLVLVI